MGPVQRDGKLSFTSDLVLDVEGFISFIQQVEGRFRGDVERNRREYQFLAVKGTSRYTAQVA